MAIIRGSKRRPFHALAPSARWPAVLLVSAVACATTVTDDELNSICADGRCTGGNDPPPEPDAGTVAGAGNGGGGSTAVAGASGAGANTGGMPGGGGSTSGSGGGGGSGGADAGEGGSAGMAGGGASGSGGVAGGGAAGGGAAGASGAGGGGAAGAAGTAGNAGAGGAAVCPARTTWTATASHTCGGPGSGCADPNGPYPASNTIDADMGTRYTSGKCQTGNEWIEIDLKVTAALDGMTLSTSSANDYARHYQIRLSGTAGNMGAPVIAEGDGATGTITVNFPDTEMGRYLLISQTGALSCVDPDDYWWSVHDITIDCAP